MLGEAAERPLVDAQDPRIAEMGVAREEDCHRSVAVVRNERQRMDLDALLGRGTLPRPGRPGRRSSGARSRRNASAAPRRRSARRRPRRSAVTWSRRARASPASPAPFRRGARPAAARPRPRGRARAGGREPCPLRRDGWRHDLLLDRGELQTGQVTKPRLRWVSYASLDGNQLSNSCAWSQARAYLIMRDLEMGTMGAVWPSGPERIRQAAAVRRRRRGRSDGGDLDAERPARASGSGSGCARRRREPMSISARTTPGSVPPPPAPGPRDRR